VRGDRIQLQQVVLNLLLNAFDAMDAADAPRVVAVSAAREGADSVSVAVSDSGHGLPDGSAERLFRPFCTSRPDGLGLGLSISRSIVEMHGGRIWARNNAGRGATFSFTLPIEAASSAGRARVGS
jgi:two-component system, LuxR family, sensor kinase FixL